jgi:hypothetical protein
MGTRWSIRSNWAQSGGTGGTQPMGLTDDEVEVVDAMADDEGCLVNVSKWFG